MHFLSQSAYYAVQIMIETFHDSTDTNKNQCGFCVRRVLIVI
jgi:hypothetical protein